MYIFLAGLLLVQFIFIFGYYFLYSPDLYVRPSNDIYIHPIEKTLSGKKHKSLTIRPNGALGSVKTCLYSKALALYNITGCLFFKLSCMERKYFEFQETKPSNKLAPVIFWDFHCVAFSIVHTFHLTFFQTGVYTTAHTVPCVPVDCFRVFLWSFLVIMLIESKKDCKE